MVTMTEDECGAWEAQQHIRFELADGRPLRLPGDNQGSSRVARVRQSALRVLTNETAVKAWMAAVLVEFGGLEPEALAADSEEGCQLVLRALATMGRKREAAGG